MAIGYRKLSRKDHQRKLYSGFNHRFNLNGRIELPKQKRRVEKDCRQNGNPSKRGDLHPAVSPLNHPFRNA